MSWLSHFQDRKGIAWIPVILLGLLGAGVVTSAAVLYNDWSTGREARQNRQTEAAKQILSDELNTFFNNYRHSCFSLVASVGNRAVYQKALNDVILAYSASRTLNAQASYSSGALFTSQPVERYDLQSGATRVNLQQTIWHELTHHLEVQHGDRLSFGNLNPNRTTVTQRNERHTEYMEHALGVLQQLIRLEGRVKRNELTAKQIRDQLTALDNRLKSGSANTYEAVPSDLNELASYTGFQVDFQKIIDLYKKGSCLKFPDGTFDAADSAGGTTDADESNRYVVFEGTNATVGIVIGTKKQYETEEPASSYPGGGLDPNYILEKTLLSGDQTFATFEEAEKWICDQLTEVDYWPLGIGWRAKYGGRDVFLANTSCGK